MGVGRGFSAGERGPWAAVAGGLEEGSGDWLEWGREGASWGGGPREPAPGVRVQNISCQAERLALTLMPWGAQCAT